MNNRTLYEQIAQTINERYESYRHKTNQEIAELMCREYEGKIGANTIFSIMQGIKGTRAYIRETLK